MYKIKDTDILHEKGELSIELFNYLNKIKALISNNLLIEGDGEYNINNIKYHDGIILITREECQEVIDFLTQLKPYLLTDEEIGK